MRYRAISRPAAPQQQVAETRFRSETADIRLRYGRAVYVKHTKTRSLVVSQGDMLPDTSNQQVCRRGNLVACLIGT